MCKNDVVGYGSLRGVLGRAYAQASSGKGHERHAVGKPFDEQPMQRLIELYGVGFALGQAAKKAQESQRLPAGRDVAELLGAINYLAGAVIYLEKQRLPVPANDNNDQPANCCPTCGFYGGNHRERCPLAEFGECEQ